MPIVESKRKSLLVARLATKQRQAECLAEDNDMIPPDPSRIPVGSD